MTVDSAGRSRRTTRRTDTDDPRRSREQAFNILFQADVRQLAPAEVLTRLASEPQAREILADDDAPRTIDAFTRSLVEGVVEELAAIDALLATFARRWKVARMPAVDRTVLRLATYELLHESTPPAVVIDEAISLAKSLSTSDSGRYVNGVLEAVRQHRHDDDGPADPAL